MSTAITAGRLKTYASFVKIEHTIFSLPLIFAGTLLGTRGMPSARLAVLLLLAAIGGRAMGMGLNRLIDAKSDARNPRTRQRELPRGAMSRLEAWMFIVVAGVVYLVSAWAIAPICVQLAPIPVMLFAAYPYLKRFTALAHLGLGLTWSMGPLAGWVAASQDVSRFGQVLWLWLFAVLWVTGFDIIYATMDEAFDRQEGLHSLPVSIGKRPALWIAALLHAGAWLCLALLWFRQLHSDAALLWLAAIGALFMWQHVIAGKRPEFAFFRLNGILGFLVLGFIWTGV